MWAKPWHLTEGFIMGSGLVVTGLLLQFTVGSIDWDLFAWPANIVLLVLLLAVAIAAHCLRRHVYLFRYLSTPQAAVPALLFAVVLTAIMGVTRQQTPQFTAHGNLGISYMLGYWPFVLVYAWMALILALTILRRLQHPRWRDIPFYLNHLGLLIVLLCGTLGSADMHRLTMTVGMENAEWRAVDRRTGKVVELPVAVQLERFTLDEYPPSVVLANRRTGKVVATNPPVEILQTLDKAAPIATADSTWYIEWPSSGAVTALYVKADSVSGWLSGGSYLFPTQMLAVNDSLSLAMAEREPRAYVSRVHIYTETGKNILTNIEVNKPFEVDGWKIYQLDYDRSKGRWSDITILELVTDPWLPAVYAGIAMLLLGALSLLLTSPKKASS